MKFGVREICDVVLRAKNRMLVGNKMFYKNEPVIYFDTLKTSSMEGAATTVYANGGRGNARLMAWEGERTVTFTMEDALMSPEGFMILSGAGLIDASKDKPIYQHVTETVDAADVVYSTATDGNNTVATVEIPLSQQPYLPKNKGDNFAYVMFMRDGEIVTEPYIPVHTDAADGKLPIGDDGKYHIQIAAHECYDDTHPDTENPTEAVQYVVGQIDQIKFDSILVDFYVARYAAQQIEITPEQFGGNFYLEASTLFRAENGVDIPAEFIIPNCKIQSSFTFTMASSGDPSSFTFTMDAFPDYTRFDHSKKVFAALQIIKEQTGDTAGLVERHRGATPNGDYIVDGSDGTTSGIDPHEDLWSNRIQP